MMMRAMLGLLLLIAAPGAQATVTALPPHDNAFHLSGNLITLVLTSIGTGCVIITLMLKINRDRKSDAKLKDATIETRFVTAENKIADFLPRSEIEMKLLHETASRKEAEGTIWRKVEAHDAALMDMRKDVTRIEQHQVDQGDGIKRIEAGLTRVTDILLGMVK